MTAVRAAEAAPRLRISSGQRPVVLAAAMISIGVLVVLPVGMLVYGSFRTSPPGLAGELTFENYAVLADPTFWALAKNSIIVTAGSTVVAMILGGALSFVIVRVKLFSPRLLDSLVVLPAYITPFIGALGWSMLLSPRVGWLNDVFASVGLPTFNIYSLGGMIWVMGIYQTPLVYLFLKPALLNIDRSLEEAARVTGASARTAARGIVMPLLIPAGYSALLICVVNVLGQFAVPGVLGGPDGIDVIPTYLVTLVQEYPPQPNVAAVMGLALASLTVFMLWLSNRVLRRRDYVVTGRAGLAPQLRSPVSRTIGLGLCVGYLVVAVLLPVGIMLAGSFQRAYTPNFDSGFTLANYEYVLTYPSIARSITNTMQLALGAALVGTVLAVLVGYIVVRTTVPGRQLLENMSISPLAIPDNVFGLALLWTWITIPIGVYATKWILLIAFVALFLPYSSRAAISAFRQVSVELEDASRVLGGSWLLTLRRIVVPLLAPAMLGSAIIIVYYSVRELAAALLLYSVGSEVISVVIWEMYASGKYVELFALSMIQVLMVLVLVWVAKLIGRRVNRLEHGMV